MKYLLSLLFVCTSLVAQDHFVIGICGGTCSGKTTFSGLLESELGKRNINYVNQDAFYKPLDDLSMEERLLVNFDHPSSIDFDLILETVRRLKSGKKGFIPKYSFELNTRVDGGKNISPRPIILVDGHLIYSSAELAKEIDLKIYVDTDDDLRMLRRVTRDLKFRDLETITKMYTERVMPMYKRYVKPTRSMANIVVFGDRDNSVTVKAIATIAKNSVGHKE
ncbi:MAG: uridine kinase [Simkaniaceae bacterium]|nr:uridine kinase [Simkaniaceae bacterium]